MPRHVSVLFVHGIGVDNPNYADGMIKAIKKRLKKLGAYAHCVPAYWGGIVRTRQQVFFESAQSAAGLADTKSRRLALQGLGDAAAYQKTQSRFDAPYYKIQECVRDTIKELDAGDDPSRPLIVIGHSLGCHILSSFIWDVNNIKQYTAEDLKNLDSKKDTPILRYHEKLASYSPFRKLETLAGIVTMGSNMPLFTFTFEKKDVTLITKARPGKSPAFPGRSLDATTAAKAQWLNYYSRNDLLGYPLRPLYALGEEEKILHDREVRSEGLLMSFAPSPINAFAAHTGYFRNGDVINGATGLIRDIITAGDGKVA